MEGHIEIEINDVLYGIAYTFEPGYMGDYFNAPEGPTVEIVDIDPPLEFDIQQYVDIVEQIVEFETIK